MARNIQGPCKWALIRSCAMYDTLTTASA